MAILSGPDNEFILLYSHHSFGRLAEKVDTMVQEPVVSRLHAVIKWHEDHWTLRDVSSNGTWINGQRIPQNHTTFLKLNDSIKFGSPHAGSYHVLDLSSPKDALIQSGIRPGCKPGIIYLLPYQFLPDEQQPELVIYQQANNWCMESLSQANSTVRPLENSDIVHFANQQWYLRKAKLVDFTLPVAPETTSPEEVELLFNVSQDEEHCKLEINYLGQQVDLAKRSHHALSLALARYRYQDQKKHHHPNEQGWVYVDQLIRDLGLDEQHINIQIHRARKQIADTFHKTMDCSVFIERRMGQVRLGFPRFSIVKGGTPECAAG